MTTSTICDPADYVASRACLIDCLSVGLAIAAGSSRVRSRHVKRALSSIVLETFELASVLAVLDHFASNEAPLCWTRHARHGRDRALVDAAKYQRAIPGSPLSLAMGRLEQLDVVCSWASPRRFGRGAVLNLMPAKERDHARILMVAMIGVTALDGDPIVSTAHALRIANLLGANSARARVRLEADVRVRLPRAAARESREQSFAFFLQSGQLRQPVITREFMTPDALRVLRVLTKAVAENRLTLPAIGSDFAGSTNSGVTDPEADVSCAVEECAALSLQAPPVTQAPAFDGLLLGWEGNVVAGAHSRRAMTPIRHRGDGHLITIAPTGAGKGVGAVIPALLSHAGSAVVVDPKGENYAVTAAFRRALGQHVFVLDPFGITGATSDRLNPLDLFGTTGTVSREDALLLTQLLATSPAVGPRNRYWYDRGNEFLSTALLIAGNSETQRVMGLEGVMSLFSDNISTLRHMGRMLSRSTNQDLQDASGILLAGREDLLHSVSMVAHSMVATLDDPAVLAVCAGPSTLPLDMLTQDVPLTIYLVLPPDKLVSHAALLRVWVGMLLTAVQRRTAIPLRPTLFLLDEASQLGTLPQLVTAITLMRGYGLQVWSFWQDLAQLWNLYPKVWPTLLHNCAVHQVFGVPNEAAAQELAELNGITDHRALLDTNGRTLLLSRAGRLPEVVRRASYLSDAAFAGLGAENRMYSGRVPAASNVRSLSGRTASAISPLRKGGAL